MKKNIALFLLACMTLPASAQTAEHPVNQQWKDQEIWTQFTEKETGGGFKMSRPRPTHHIIKPDSVLTPVYEAAQPSRQDPDAGPTYLLAPSNQPLVVPSITQIETTVVPVLQPSVYPFSYGSVPYWGRRQGFWGYRPITRVIQTGPSKSSGNYFNPSTPDPTASGNYFAGSGNAPRAVPVYRPEQSPKDYWGKHANPLPPEMRPE